MVEIVEKKVVDITYYGYYISNNNFIYHREDGPAVIWANGKQIWYINGKRHREDGPAIIRSDGTQEWCINDIFVTDEVKHWHKERNIDKNNMTDEDKLALRFFMRSL